MSETIRDYSRQSSLVIQDRLATHTIHLIGCGAVGRNVGLMLASIGAQSVILWDDDRVDQSNVTTQGYCQLEIGSLKGLSLADAMQRINLGMKTIPTESKWTNSATPRFDRQSIVILCPDNMPTRKRAYQTARQAKVALFLDARMLGESSQCYALSSPAQWAWYESTLHDASESEQGRCTARSTLYAANTVASALIHQLARWTRGQSTYSSEGLPGEYYPITESMGN